MDKLRHAQGEEGVCKQELRGVGFKLLRGIPFERHWGHPVEGTPPGGMTGGHANAWVQRGFNGVRGPPSQKAFARINCRISEGTHTSLPQSGRGQGQTEGWEGHTWEVRGAVGSHRSVQTRWKPELPRDTKEKHQEVSVFFHELLVPVFLIRVLRGSLTSMKLQVCGSGQAPAKSLS